MIIDVMLGANIVFFYDVKKKMGGKAQKKGTLTSSPFHILKKAVYFMNTSSYQ